jgi:PAS domain S-box-containing protein
MDHSTSQWIRKHEAAIKQRWWVAAHEMGQASDESFALQSQAAAFDLGPFRSRLLAILAADETLDPRWADTLARELSHRDVVALLGALRQVLFDLLVQDSASPDVAGRWRTLEGRLNRIELALAQAQDSWLSRIDARRDHWQTLYSLTRELSASIDLSYVLQGAIALILDALNVDRGAVFVLDSKTNLVIPRATRNWPVANLPLANLPTDWQRGYGSPIVLEDDIGGGSPFGPFKQDGAETVVVAPLLANGRFHGMLTIATAEPEGFQSQQLDFIGAVASNLTTSLGSSEVIQTLNDQARELGLMLRQQQEESSKRESILASIADGVVFNDQAGRIILVNRAAEIILERCADSLIGQDLNELFDVFEAGGRDDLLKAMKAVQSNPTMALAPERAQNVLQMDARVIQAHVSPVVTERDQFLGVVTIFRDITKEVEADRAKSDFVSTVSHELRTPMTAIKGYTDLIHSGMVGEINENQKRFLGIIKTNTDRLTALINDLLDISRVETGRVRFEPRPIDLGDIVKNVIDGLAPNAEHRQHILTYRVEAGLPKILGDPDRLNQVFTNLVSNAINYTTDGGKVSVDVYAVEGAIRVDVQDTGIGIRAEDLRKIFERFYRADHPFVQESRGSGLGLSIVKMFVEMHGGRVWAQSKLGTGSTFTVLMPFLAEKSEAGPERFAPERAILSDRPHVLVADDDADIAELMKLQLQDASYRTSIVGRGVQVLEVARRQRPDLIILDILLPDMDGRAVLEALKAEPMTADIPVVMLTVVADDGSAFELGAAGYLNKPIDGDELLEAVEMALSRRGRILLVEDDVDTIEMMRVALRRVGYNVDVAADGYEALALARRWRPQAIVLDLRLPGMDGYEALTHLKRNLNTQDIPILVVSAHVADWEAESKRLKAMGVNALLPKPFTVNRLIVEMDEVLAAKSWH